MTPDAERLCRVLGAPQLSWLVDRIHSRLERGVPLDGAVTLNPATLAQRQAVARLLGRPVGRGKSLSVPLAKLEAALHAAGLAADLRAAVEAMTGPVTDFAGARTSLEGRRAAARAAASACRHIGSAWHTAWLEQISSDGTVTRLLRAGRDEILPHAAAVLDLLPAAEMPLPVLAEHATGDTKALSGPPLSGLVLRALALWQQVAVPETREGRRSLWETVGVIVDDLSSEVLVLNLRASGSPLGRWLTEAAAHGTPFRVTLHQLTSMPITLDEPVAYVCENPAVVRAAATELGPRSAPLICTEGIPSAACHRLAREMRHLRWRGDFDWVGVRTTAAAIDRYCATPWRMTADDYVTALAGGTNEPLKGTPVPTPWDARLKAEMSGSERAVMEERLLPTLLGELDTARTPSRAAPEQTCGSPVDTETG